MNKKVLLLPVVLLGILMIVNWGCEKDEDDVCEKFDAIADLYPSCDIPAVCCPIDGGDCYIVNPTGDDYMCNKDNATPNDPDGCDQAENDYIDEKCTSKMSAEQRKGLKKELRKFTKELMEKTRTYSICC
jgi:hypothetical protein